MQNILRELFENDYKPRIHFHKMSEQDAAAWDRAQKILGSDTVDQLTESLGETAYETHFDYFREGFRLGALLMRELM